MTRLEPFEAPRRSLQEFIDYAASLGISTADAKIHYRISRNDKTFTNDVYLVICRDVPKECNPGKVRKAKWLSVRRLDGQKIAEWADLQNIKNQVLGENGEAIQIFPAQDSAIDSVNQYHLFGAPDWKAPFRFSK